MSHCLSVGKLIRGDSNLPAPVAHQWYWKPLGRSSCIGLSKIRGLVLQRPNIFGVIDRRTPLRRDGQGAATRGGLTLTEDLHGDVLQRTETRKRASRSPRTERRYAYSASVMVTMLRRLGFGGRGRLGSLCVGVRDLVHDLRFRHLRSGAKQERVVALRVCDEDRCRKDASGHHSAFAVMWMSGTYRTGIAAAAPAVHTWARPS